MIKKVAILAFIAIIYACKNKSSNEGPFNLGDVKKIIQEDNKLYRLAFLTGDSAAFADLHHSKTINMPPDAPLMVGQGAMGAMIKNVPKYGIIDYTVQSTNIYGGPEDVIEEGKYEIDGKGKTLEKGKYIVIWKKDKRIWKIYRTIWNKDSK